MIFIRRLFLMIACVAVAAPSLAAPQLTLDVRPVVPRVRSHAPVAVEVMLDWQRPKLLEGTLQLSLYDGRQYIGRCVLPDLALTTGVQRHRLTLPPLTIRSTLPYATVQGQFISKDKVYEFDPIDIPLTEATRRVFVVAVPHAAGQLLSEAEFAFVESLSLEQFNPSIELRGEITASIERIEVGTLPTNSLGFVSYDLVVLEGEGWAMLKETQLTAIADWIEAGGSACVVLNRTVTAAHTAFLNRMTGAGGTAPSFLIDDNGNVSSDHSPAMEKWSLHRSGLGRTLILHSLPDAENEKKTIAWQKAVASLWHLRAEQMPHIAATGKWYFIPPTLDYLNGFEKPHPFTAVPIAFQEPLRDQLVPAKIKGMPLSVVAAILIVFLLAIAPGDYFLLGWLRARRYTWLLFTAISLGVTYFTVSLTQRSMGTVDYRTALVIADVIDGNKTARTSRYELQFTATQKTVATEFRNTLYVPQDERVGDWRESRSLRKKRPPGFEGEQYLDDSESTGILQEPPVYDGRMPNACTIRQPMRQWSPRLNRQTRFGGPPPLTGFDWDAVQKLDLSNADERDELGQRILRISPAARIRLFHESEIHSLDRHLDDVPSPLNVDVHDPNTRFFPFVQEVSRRPPSAMFKLMSRIAPTGGMNFEDLALLDTGDPSQWLLVVLVPGDEECVVYRRLYEGNL